MAQNRRAIVVRMVLPDHICPYGVKAKALLEERDYEVEDRILRSRDEVEAFKAEHEVRTTPLVFIGGDRIGGCDDLERFLETG
jgi:glutaredoxin 3